MKTKHNIILLVFGYCLDFPGGLFKIMHRLGADTILTVAAVMKIAGGLLFLHKLVTYPKWKDFLNS
jgi:hypothetical protein